MDGVDTSFYPKPPGDNDILRIASETQSLFNAQAQNKLLQQESQLRDQHLIQQHAATYDARMGLIANELARQWAVSNGDPSHDHVVDGVTNLMTKNPELFDKNFAAQVLADMPSREQMAKDPSAMKSWVLGGAARIEQTRAAIRQFLPQPHIEDLGNVKRAIDLNPLTNKNLIGTQMVPGLSPREASEPTDIGYDANNQPIRGTRSDFIRRAQGGNPISSGGSVPPGTVIPGGAKLSDYMVEPKAGPAANSASGGGIVMGPPPGVLEARKKVGEASGAHFAEDVRNTSNLQQAIFPLTQAIPALERLGPQGTGPGTETINNLRSLAISLAGDKIPERLAKSMGDATKDYDEVRKYLVQYATTVGGMGTNDKLAAAFSGNPSTKISNAAAVDVAKSAVALARMKAVAPIVFQGTGLGEDQYSKWHSRWSQSQDPRAFGVDMMSPERRNAMLDGMSQSERQRFLDSYQDAIDAGILPVPSRKTK